MVEVCQGDEVCFSQAQKGMVSDILSKRPRCGGKSRRHNEVLLGQVFSKCLMHQMVVPHLTKGTRTGTVWRKLLESGYGGSSSFEGYTSDR